MNYLCPCVFDCYKENKYCKIQTKRQQTLLVFYSRKLEEYGLPGRIYFTMK